MAAQSIHGFDLATYGFCKFAELDAATDQLGDNDYHFGRNAPFTFNSQDYQYGPREVDQRLRGGRVLESPVFNNYCEAKRRTKSATSEVTSLKAFWRDKFQGVKPDAKRVNIQEFESSYKSASSGKTEENCDNNFNMRFCKTAILWVKEKVPNGRIHFHLDGMGDVLGICLKQETLNNRYHSITARELRFVFRNWGELHQCTTLYNGYTDVNGVLRPVKVDPKWIT